MRTFITLLGLTLTLHMSAQCYNVLQGVYGPDPFNGGTSVSFSSDDAWSAADSIGFSFCFYGAQYTQLVVGCNGIVSFDLSTANGSCPWPISTAIPSPSNPKNTIMLPWQDLYPTSAPGRVRIAVYGNSPNRRCVISYDSIPMYGQLTSFFTGQVKLFETTNVIEIHMHSKQLVSGWNSGRAILGLHNSTGMQFAVVPGRNSPNQWTATNEAWVFSPVCNVCTGVGIAEETTQADLQLFPNPVNDVLHVQYNAQGKLFAMELTDQLGRVLYADDAVAEETREVRVDGFARGLYFVRIVDEEGKVVEVKKVVLQ